MLWNPVIVYTYIMYLEFNNMERGMKGTRIVTVEKKGLPFYWLWACALMHTDTSKDILCARRRHFLCVWCCICTGCNKLRAT